MGIDAFSDEVYDAIRAFLEDGNNWDALPIKWPNEPFSRSTPYVAFEITSNYYGQQSIGANPQSDNRWDEDGQIWLHVIVDANSGESKIRGAARALARLFRGLKLLNNRLEFGDAAIGNGAPGDEDGSIYRISVNVEWVLSEAT